MDLIKKQHYLQAAWDYINQHGFHASSVDELSAALGITKRTLYRYFETKEQLIVEVLDYRHQQFVQQLQCALGQFIGMDAAIAYINFIELWVKQPHFYGCSFINASAEYSDVKHPVHHIATTHKNQLLQLLKSYNLTTAQVDVVFLLGEGLIVSSQVMGFNRQHFDRAEHIIKLYFSQQ